MVDANSGAEPLILSDAPRPLVRRLTLNRPHKRNALSNALRGELFAALEAADADPEVRVIAVAPEKNPRGPGEGRYRVLRGGSWFDTPDTFLTCSYRSWARQAERSPTIGFRCVKNFPR